MLSQVYQNKYFEQYDRELLSEIGINILDFKLVKIQKRTYYKNIVQCLRKCKNVSSQESIKYYLESIEYLCKIKELFPIKIILNKPFVFNQIFPEIVASFSEYLLFNGLELKLVAICEKILKSFENERVNLVEIEILYVKSKSEILDRISAKNLIKKIVNQIENNINLYIEYLVIFANLQLKSREYQAILKNFEKSLNLIKLIQENKLDNNCYNQKKINLLKVFILEGIAWLRMKAHQWKKSLLGYDRAQYLCENYNLNYKLIYILGHRGILQRKMKRYNSALKDLQEAKKIAQQMNIEISIESIEHHIAYIFLNQGKYDLAEQLAQQCLNSLKSKQRDDTAGDNYDLMGIIKLAKNQVSEAIEKLEYALSYRKRVGNSDATASSYTHLSLAYFIDKNYLKSYQAILKCTTLFYELKFYKFKLKIVNLKKFCKTIYIFFDWTIGKKKVTP